VKSNSLKLGDDKIFKAKSSEEEKAEKKRAPIKFAQRQNLDRLSSVAVDNSGKSLNAFERNTKSTN